MSTVILVVVCCVAYPLLVCGIGQLAFRDKANGSIITDAHGTVRGSALLGQNFSGAQYFHPRPSAAGTGYDALNSGGSNLGPSSQKLNDSIKDGIKAYRQENGLAETNSVPADAVTSSASGLDPHISFANAQLQATRVAKARGLSLVAVRALIQQHTEGPQLGFLGETTVNVLQLNLALDHEAEKKP